MSGTDLYETTIGEKAACSTFSTGLLDVSNKFHSNEESECLKTLLNRNTK